MLPLMFCEVLKLWQSFFVEKTIYDGEDAKTHQGFVQNYMHFQILWGSVDSFLALKEI